MFTTTKAKAAKALSPKKLYPEDRKPKKKKVQTESGKAAPNPEASSKYTLEP